MKAAAVLIAFLAAPPAFAQGPDGAQVFAASCSNCHNGAADSRAPALDALRSRAPEAIVEALMTGAMRAQGSRLSGAERRAVAEFVTGKGMGGDVTGAAKGRCAAAPSTGAIRDFAIVPHWTGWSPSPTNTRFQPADRWRGPSRRSPTAACSSAARTEPSTRSTRRPAASTGRSAPAAVCAPPLSCRRRARPRRPWSTSATRPRMRMRSTRPRVRWSGFARWTSIRSRASRARRRSMTAGSTYPCPRTRKRRAPTRSIRAAPSAAA